MTLLLPVPMPATATQLRWSFIDEDLWVGDNDGAFAGTIDPQGGHFHARDQFGQYLGDYPTLAGAKNRLEAHATGAAA